jgi:endonuclease III
MKSTPVETWKRLWPVLGTKYKRDKTFLDYQTPWELLVAVILSAQTTDDLINKVTPDLFKAFPTVQTMAKAPVGKITEAIKRVNYFNAKGRYVSDTAKAIVRDYDGEVPLDETELRKLSGVGRKTAVAVLTNLVDEPIGIPVDTHVIRFANRFGLSSAKDASKIEQDLLKIIPKRDWRRAGYAIKEYGRKEGRARNYKPDEDPVWKIVNK